jgi:hypothetical protein
MKNENDLTLLNVALQQRLLERPHRAGSTTCADAPALGDTSPFGSKLDLYPFRNTHSQEPYVQPGPEVEEAPASLQTA